MLEDTTSLKLEADKGIVGASSADSAQNEGTILAAASTWARQNLLNPVLNSGLIDPINTVSHNVNRMSQATLNRDLLGKLEVQDVGQTEFGGASWLVQSVVGGLAGAIPYAVAGKFGGGLARKVGSALGVQGRVARGFQHQMTAQLVGSVMYDGLREARDGETWDGNSLGSAVGFTVFEGGNMFAGGRGLVGKFAMRTATGFVGGGLQHLTAMSWAQGERPDNQSLLQAAISGAAMNTVLPVAQNQLGKGINFVQKKMGAGVPLDHYLNDVKARDGELSPTVQQLANNNAWARVQPDAQVTAYDHANNRVYLEPGADQGKLANELSHGVQQRQGQFAAEFANVGELARKGDTDGAWKAYREIRLQQEVFATQAEHNAQVELDARSTGRSVPGRGSATDSKVALEQLLPSRQVVDGKTYEQVWRSDFETAIANGGTFDAPPLSYATRIDRAGWARTISSWKDLRQGQKIEALKHLSSAPAEQQVAVWKSAIGDTDQYVRVQAASSIGKLPIKKRVEAWLEAARHEDHCTKVAALSNLGALSAAERQFAFRQALSRREVLNEAPAESPNSRSKLWGDNMPEWLETLREQNQKKNKGVEPEAAQDSSKKYFEPPTVSLVRAIETLRRGEQMEAWSLVFQDRRTRSEAIRQLTVLHPDHRWNAWNRAWNSSESDTSIWMIRDRKLRQEMAQTWSPGSDINKLVEFLPQLSADRRVEAWEKVVTSKHLLYGDETFKALECLPLDDAQKLTEWYRLAERAREHVKVIPPLSSWGVERRETIPVKDTAAAAAIGALAPADRYGAWQHLERTVPADRRHELVNGIKHLPAENRIDAFNAIASSVPESQAKYVLYRLDIPVADLGKLAESILALPEGKAKQDLMDDFSFNDAYDGDMQMRKTTAFDTMHSILSKDEPQRYEFARKVWWKLPEKYDDHTGLIKQDVRTMITDHMDPAKLAIMLYGSENRRVAERIARERPDAIRNILRMTDELPDGEDRAAMVRVATDWVNTGSIEETMLEAVRTAGPEVPHEVPTPVPHMLVELAKGAPKDEIALAVTAMQRVALPPSGTADGARIAMRTAAILGHYYPEVVAENFCKPMQAALADSSVNYVWRLRTAREIASIQRSHEMIPVREASADSADALQFKPLRDGMPIEIPNLRMPQEVFLSPQEQMQLRDDSETALFDKKRIGKMLGRGRLGQLFPTIFGMHAESGIVGRPQHGGHEFNVDVHTLHVLNRVREHPEFNSLSRKDQVNLLWAALLHDVGKQAGQHDLDHEWASANMSWGVLTTLGYPSTRIQRIANLVSRHADVSFIGGQKMLPGEHHNRSHEHDGDGDTDGHESSARSKHAAAVMEAAVTDAASFYRHPSALGQLNILNESDIRSITAQQRHWTPEVAHRLRQISGVLRPAVERANNNAIPILTSELPNRFGLFSMDREYALLGHASGYLGDSFMRQLAVIESPEYSISTTLITRNYQRFYDPRAEVVALLSGPSEMISQAGPRNLGTGRNVTWQDHVALLKEFSTDADVKVVQTLNSRIRAIPGAVQSGITSLSSLWTRLGQFDTLDELHRTAGPNSVLWKGMQEVIGVMTTEDGVPLKKHNEVKLNNPTLEGIGILRRGRPLFIEGFPASNLDSLLNGAPRPSFLLTEKPVGTNYITIPLTTWTEAQRRRLPLMILDP